MKKQNRRTFITSAAALSVTAASPLIAMNKEKPVLVHHVFFWLKNPGSAEDRAKLIAGLRTLEKIESVRQLHIGVPADTAKRPVVDSSYSASELIFFDDVAGQNIYQDHPVHVKFVQDHSHLWEKVVVYDSLSV
jgi:hypothetical protein